MFVKDINIKVKDRIRDEWIKLLAIEFPQQCSEGAIVYLEWNKKKKSYDRIATNWSNPSFDVYVNNRKVKFKNRILDKSAGY